MSEQHSNINPLAPFDDASEEVKKIMRRVLELERDKLYQARPGLKDDIITIIKEEVQ